MLEIGGAEVCKQWPQIHQVSGNIFTKGKREVGSGGKEGEDN